MNIWWKLWMTIIGTANLVCWFRIKRWHKWINFAVGIWCLSTVFSTPFIHSYYWLLRKTGLRQPGKITEMIIDGNRVEFTIDKLDPGEIIILPFEVEIEKEVNNGTEI